MLGETAPGGRTVTTERAGGDFEIRSHGDFEIHSQGRLAIVRAPASVGRLNAQQLWESLAAACTAHRVVIVDMTQTADCNLDALTALLMALRFTGDGGADLRVAGSAAVRDLFASTPVGDLLKPFASVRDALPERRADRRRRGGS